jgi:hypothetical protein
MQPRDLKAEHFAGYPPEARKLMVAHLDLLRNLPLSFVPSMLREAIDYDYRFPAERSALDRELADLSALTPEKLSGRFESFAKVSLSPTLEAFDWINLPAQFVEQQSAYLWSTHQLDAFRKAASDYGAELQSAAALEPPPVRRLGIAVIGQGVSSYDGKLFRNLRQHGTYFTGIKPLHGFELLLGAVESRAKTKPAPYGHWYVDGGPAAPHGASITGVSYAGLEPVRGALLKRMQAEIASPGMGPEELRTRMARMQPADLGMDKNGDPILDRFKLKVLTEGSGTQIYSTTFAQWTTREVLRRAQALTLLVRFAPRQRQRPLNELIAGAGGKAEADPVGSLIDADMGAWYHWINQQRLSGSEQSSFIAWFEGHEQAVAIGPSFPKGTASSSQIDLGQLLKLATT